MTELKGKKRQQARSRPDGWEPAAVVVQLELTCRQVNYAKRAVGVARFVYNRMVANDQAGRDVGLWLTPHELEKEFNAVKKTNRSLAFTTQVSKFVAQGACRKLSERHHSRWHNKNLRARKPCNKLHIQTTINNYGAQQLHPPHTMGSPARHAPHDSLAPLHRRHPAARTPTEEDRQHHLCPGQPRNHWRPCHRIRQGEQRRTEATPGNPGQPNMGSRRTARHHASMTSSPKSPVASTTNAPSSENCWQIPPSIQSVVEHRERLARFGVGMVEAMLQARGGSLLVIDDAEVPDDLVRDMTEILTCFCARLYGKRSAANRARRAMQLVND